MAQYARDLALWRQLETRRQRLQALAPEARLVHLLHEVDAALERMDAGTFGLCGTCNDAIENDRLLVDPLVRHCLDCLTPEERFTLERDLDLARQVQNGLLPKPTLAAGWSAAYHYQPAGTVSGDYCDLIPLEDGRGVFLLGDVSGKGVAASMLVAHLHAIFRSLATTARRLDELVSCANRVFCEGTVSSFFATVVCGRLDAGGAVEICNAGHCYPLLVHEGRVSPIASTGLPIGLFREGDYGLQTRMLTAGDSLVLYSDGLSDALGPTDEPYGVERLSRVVRESHRLAPRELVAAAVDDQMRFRAGRAASDDLTIMALRRDG
jgi:serine phosphatase RsbU (regulator of sigma subunit)